MAELDSHPDPRASEVFCLCHSLPCRFVTKIINCEGRRLASSLADEGMPEQSSACEDNDEGGGVVKSEGF